MINISKKKAKEQSSLKLKKSTRKIELSFTAATPLFTVKIVDYVKNPEKVKTN